MTRKEARALIGFSVLTPSLRLPGSPLPPAERDGRTRIADLEIKPGHGCRCGTGGALQNGIRGWYGCDNIILFINFSRIPLNYGGLLRNIDIASCMSK